MSAQTVFVQEDMNFIALFTVSAMNKLCKYLQIKPRLRL